MYFSKDSAVLVTGPNGCDRASGRPRRMVSSTGVVPPTP